MALPSPSRDRRFAGLKDLINHLNAVGSRGLAAIGNRSRARLQEDEKLVTLQVGKTVFDSAPRSMRTELWMSSLQRKGIGVAAAEKYEDMLLSPIGAEAAADIDKDLGRTFPTMRRFAAAEGQEALRKVLRAYAAFDPEVGYCQGMNFVAGLLLMYLPERHAFGGLVVLMQDRGLRKYFSTDMSLLQTHLWQLGRLMPPRLCAHLETIGVLPLLYGASWLMTCFSADFPASFSARVMDVIMADKMDQALLKAAVALLKRCEGKLLGMTDMEDALHLLKLELPAWEEPLLHDVLTEAFAKTWSSRQMQLLGSTEGAETVAEALARVQKANLAASMDSSISIDTSAEVPDSPAAACTTPSSSRAATPLSSAPAAAAAVMGAGGGSSSSSSVALPLFPPPPAPRRASSAGGVSGGVSPSCSRPASRAASQCGMVPENADGQAAAAACGAPSINTAAGRDDNSNHESTGVCRHDQQGTGNHVSVQQQQGDMIDMSSPRAGATSSGQYTAGAPQPVDAEDAWDPFGLHETQHPQQHRQPQQPQGHVEQQQQQQQQQHVGEGPCHAGSSTGSGQLGQQQQQHSSLHHQLLQQGQLVARAAPAVGASTAGHELLQQQLQDLSFSQIALGPLQQHSHEQLAAAGQLPPTPSGQAAQHGAGCVDDEWGDFMSPRLAD